MKAMKYLGAKWLMIQYVHGYAQPGRVFGIVTVNVAKLLHAIADLRQEWAAADQALSVEQRLQRTGRIRYR